MNDDAPVSITIDALTRLDLKPTEVLSVTVGWPDLTPRQLEEFGEYLTGWLDAHGMPAAGVLVLPQGSSLAAVRAPEDDAPTGTLPDRWGGLNRAEIREALESAAAIKHLSGQR